MKMLMLIVERDVRERVETILSESEVQGFTEIPTVFGSGTSGPRLGSRAFPDTSSIIFSVLEDDQVGRVMDSLTKDCAACPHKVHSIVWGVESLQ
ncbi:MAG: hypothetical protein R3E12_02800 [Candidatus Eisenbacteria bacterium]|uniref:Uncharacterized protein n=1 Tax=Eiseniibacteriota bacterium TaxID=2212470 RepID=A0A956RNA9_UNCEI|nr:hypothetical protein [Candidatus Eisenbacteria bacterium]